MIRRFAIVPVLGETWSRWQAMWCRLTTSGVAIARRAWWGEEVFTNIGVEQMATRIAEAYDVVQARLNAIIVLHQSVGKDGDFVLDCQACGQPYPCRTVKLADGRLYTDE
jgi:hypothetical protein